MSSCDFSQAQAYEDTCIIQKQHGQDMLDCLGSVKGFKILDLGCGTGYFSKILADLVGPEGKVVAIDPDVERLSLAKNMYTADNLEYYEGKAEDIPGTDYDIVFSNYVLHWCMDKDLVFQQVSKSLKKGGKFVFTLILNSNMGSEKMFSREFFNSFLKRLPPYSTEEYLNIASAHDFEKTYLHEKEYSQDMQDVSSLIEFYKIHTRSDFDDTHFNTDAMREYYGEGKFARTAPSLHCVLTKVDAH